MAIGGSTNAIIHVVAMARRAGIPLDMERFDELSRQVPVLANVRPSGKYLMEDFFYAGGLRALMQNLREKLDLDLPHRHRQDASARTSTAPRSISRTSSIRSTIRSMPKARPRCSRAISRRNGCVIKPAAADKRFLKHRGKAIAFEDYNHMMREIERDDLDVTPDHILVLQECRAEGRAGHAGMGHAADPQTAVGAGRARHDPHFRRAHERHQLRRLHPACRAGKLRRRPARLGADRRRDRDRRRQALASICTSATRSWRAAAPPGRRRRRNIRAATARCISAAHRPGRRGLRFRFSRRPAARFRSRKFISRQLGEQNARCKRFSERQLLPRSLRGASRPGANLSQQSRCT